jgi:hypothetical protein
MQVRMKYIVTEQTYEGPFYKYFVSVTRSMSDKSVTVKFKAKENEAFADFALPVERAKQFAYAILSAASGVGEPIVLGIDEHHEMEQVGYLVKL